MHMPNYQFAFPINNAVFKDTDLSFKVADVSFVTKSHLSKARASARASRSSAAALACIAGGATATVTTWWRRAVPKSWWTRLFPCGTSLRSRSCSRKRVASSAPSTGKRNSSAQTASLRPRFTKGLPPSRQTGCCTTSASP